LRASSIAIRFFQALLLVIGVVWVFAVCKTHLDECQIPGFLIAMAISWLVFIILSQQYVKAKAPDVSYYQTLGTLTLGAHDAFRSVLEIVFPLGALMFYYVLYQSKIIPRWISGWGLAAALLWLPVGLFGVFHLIDPMSTTQVVLSLPIGLQEMVMAVWLIAKGFNPSAIASLSAKTATNELLSVA